MNIEPLPDESDVLAYAGSLSNAGRWGADDERGTLNLIGPQARIAAARLVTAGRTVSCAWPMDDKDAPDQVYGRMHRHMLVTGQGNGDPDAPDTADNLKRGASEYLGLVFHGLHITHLDGLCHQFWDNRMYNGFPASEVTSYSGARRLAVTTAASGIVTRGVLLDAARSRGVPWLEPGTSVGPVELDRIASEQGVELAAGDAVLLRTGYGAHRRTAGRMNVKEVGQSGWGAACLPWLRDRDVALIGSDTAQDVIPGPYQSFGHGPIHMLGIAVMGLWLLDNCDLEELSRTCAELGRWEFQFVVAPLPIVGGTGSPVNPLGIF